MNLNRRRRRSIRLKGWDYRSPGYYFVTLCAHARECLFGEIVNAGMELNDFGKIAKKFWLDIPTHFPHAELDDFIVMPNHMHGIIVLKKTNRDEHPPRDEGNRSESRANDYSPLRKRATEQTFESPSRTIGSIIRGYKIGVNQWFRKNTAMSMVWQRNYYEHIIRSEKELEQVRKYVRDNPAAWSEDEENPMRIRRGE